MQSDYVFINVLVTSIYLIGFAVMQSNQQAM